MGMFRLVHLGYVDFRRLNWDSNMLKNGLLEVDVPYRCIGDEVYFITCRCGEGEVLVNISDWRACPKCGRRYKVRERITVYMKGKTGVGMEA